MKAAVLHGKRDLRYEEVQEPTPRPGEVKLKNAFSGICGSDLHVYEDPGSLSLDLSRPHPVTGASLPQVMGHEFSGIITEVGTGVENIKVGDRVAVWPTYYCGRCPACLRGLFNACTVRGLHGMHSHGGGLAEYTTVPAYMLHRLPDSVDLRMGALVQPLAVSWHGVNLAAPARGETALIVGAGPVGIGVWFALRARGIDRILVSETSPSRRETMAALGAEVIAPAAQDVAAAVLAASGGVGAQVVYEAAGVEPAFRTALEAVAPGGMTVVLGLNPKPIGLSLMSLIEKEAGVIGSSGYSQEDFEDVIAAMAAGQVDLTGWVEEMELDETAEAVHRLSTGTGSKILIRSSPAGSSARSSKPSETERAVS